MTSTASSTTGPTRPIRIGDVERDRAAEELADHFAAGRLGHDEYEERVTRALAAVHQHDLGPLFVDLPGRDRFAARVPDHQWPVLPRDGAAGVRGRRAGGPPWPMMPIPLLALPVLLLAVVLIAVLAHTPWLLFLGIWVLCLGGGRFSACRSGRRGPPRSAGGAPWRQ